MPQHIIPELQPRDFLLKAHLGSISRRLDDMFSTSFWSHIINYELPRGFFIPKFTMYDGSSDPFNHLMHFQQTMTLAIDNDLLLCKVFPANLHGLTLSSFHPLPQNFVNSFKDILEAFVAHYPCVTWQKQNISTLQNIKILKNESLRDFMKWFNSLMVSSTFSKLCELF